MNLGLLQNDIRMTQKALSENSEITLKGLRELSSNWVWEMGMGPVPGDDSKILVVFVIQGLSLLTVSLVWDFFSTWGLVGTGAWTQIWTRA